MTPKDSPSNEKEKINYRDWMYFSLGILMGIAITLLWMNVGWIR